MFTLPSSVQKAQAYITWSHQMQLHFLSICTKVKCKFNLYLKRVRDFKWYKLQNSRSVVCFTILLWLNPQSYIRLCIKWVVRLQQHTVTEVIISLASNSIFTRQVFPQSPTPQLCPIGPNRGPSLWNVSCDWSVVEVGKSIRVLIGQLLRHLGTM